MSLTELKTATLAFIAIGALTLGYLIWTGVQAYRTGVTYGTLVKGPIRRSENPNLYWRNVLMFIPATIMMTAAIGWFGWAYFQLP